jgi:hypothetical protein
VFDRRTKENKKPRFDGEEYEGIVVVEVYMNAWPDFEETFGEVWTTLFNYPFHAIKPL